MKKKEELAYLKKQWSRLSSRLRGFKKKGKQEDLHRFRVQVKKVRSLLVLADSQGGTAEKQLKPVRKIFKAAGEIRNAYLNHEMAREQAGDLAAGQQKIIKKTSKKFRSRSYRGVLKKTQDRLQRYLPKLNDLHISAYYDQQLQVIGDSLVHPKSDDGLHGSRKQLKMLIYNYQLVKPVLSAPLNEDYLEEVQTAIGDWHDKQVAIDLFSGDPHLVAQLKKERAGLKRKVTRIIKDFYNRATTTTELPLPQID